MGRKKQSNIGRFHANKNEEQGLADTAEEQLKRINSLQMKIYRREERCKLLEAKQLSLDKRLRAFSKVSPSLVNRRKLKPTNSSLNSKVRQSRRKETWEICHSIHGGSNDNPSPTLCGLMDTFAVKQKVSDTTKMLCQKPAIRKALTKQLLHNNRRQFYKSLENKKRSLNVYYSHNVMGKRKYVSLRKANKCGDGSNFIQYIDLSRFINSIDIGVLKDINDFNDTGTPSTGFYRDIRTYALRLAEFYLRVDVTRVDKLQFFATKKKDPRAKVFLLSIGGDGAPLVGTLFLVSFINVVKRVASSFNNFMICGTDEKEDSPIVKAYVYNLISDLHYLESKTFEIVVDGVTHYVEFKVELIPNDMKMLNFLAGELTNGSYYFTTFANVNVDDADDLKKSFSFTGGPDSWKPWDYKDRLMVVPQVEEKKAKLSSHTNKVKARSLLTQYIGKKLHHRQEFVPPFGKYIDLARCEPLHLKNNVVKDLFIRLLNLVLSSAKLPSSVHSFVTVPENNIFKIFITLVKKFMDCNQLAYKVMKWFDLHAKSTDASSLDLRFRGKESFKFLHKFQVLFSKLYDYIPDDDLLNFTVLYYMFIQVRHNVSLSARIYVDVGDLEKLKVVARKLFCVAVRYGDGNLSPSLWVMCNVVPHHAKDLYERFGYGLGLGVMEGREQKNQAVKRYIENTTVQNKWIGVFKHEFMQLIYLKENGFDDTSYNRKQKTYYPGSGEDSCQTCFLSLVDGVCQFCDSDIMMDIIATVNKHF